MSWNQDAQATAQMAAAEHELDMVTDLFNKIVDTCHKKCIPPTYIEPDLNTGESVCIDRCVYKYFEVNKKVGEKLQSQSQQKAMA